MNRLNNERGIALAVAIFALVVIGGLIAGSFFVANLEQRVGRNTLQQQSAFNAAEAANQDRLLNWNAQTYNQMQIGGTIMDSGLVPGGVGYFRRTMQRINQNLYVVSTDGFNVDPNASGALVTARQRLGSLIRLRPLAFNIGAALMTQGNLRVGGSSKVSGADSVPPGWPDCPPADTTLPGIRMPDVSKLQTFGACSGGSCITGDPKVMQDSTITTGSLTTVGDIPFEELKQYATKVIPGGNPPNADESLTMTGACDTGDLYNWGNPLLPTSPCAGYFPIIWADGDLALQGTYGQGVLIVNGNLTVTGGLMFFGPVLVRGSLSTSGTGGHFIGGVIAANVELAGDQTVVGNAEVQYSSCALIKAMSNSAPPWPMRERSWVNLY